MSYTSEAFEAARARLAAYRVPLELAPAIAPDIMRTARWPIDAAAEPADGPLQAAVRCLRTGEATAVSLVESALQAIAAHDPRTHAVVANLGDAARATARQIDAGPWRGPLHGIPFSVKDNIDVSGAPTRAGSAAYSRVAEADAESVALSRAAGGIPIAKVATHEFALGVTTPQARHPLDPDRIPGGSSGGSAISIATGMALASLGTDTRASIRVPSSLCGVVGYKPTYGTLPRGGVVWLSWTMDHVGLLAGSVGDAAYVADALVPGAGLHDRCSRAVRGLRLGVPDAAFIGASPTVSTAVRVAIDSLTQQGAATLDLGAPTADDFDLANAAGLIVSRAEALDYHRSIRTDFNLLWPETADQFAVAAQLSVHEYFAAQRFRADLGVRMRACVDAAEIDALVMPTTLVTAPRVVDAERHFTALSRNAIPWSFLGWPVVSVPCGSDDQGLPIGLQVVARPGEDGLALRVARGVESALRGASRRHVSPPTSP